MLANCKACKKNFEPQIERRTLDDDIQEILFKCPHCQEEYHVAFTNAEIRTLNEELQTLKAQLLKDKNNKKLFRQTQRLMRTHKKLMDELNKQEAV